jgi:hypothetical protein
MEMTDEFSRLIRHFQPVLRSHAQHLKQVSRSLGEELLKSIQLAFFLDVF